MLRRFIPFFLFLTVYLHSESTHLLLKGYLSRDVIAAAEQQLQVAEKKKGEELVIQVNSSSGDIYEVLGLAKKVYDFKMESDKHVIVYIQGKAVGPAAILPFLADELIVTPLVAWGDIPYGVGDQMSTNAIRRAVVSLINPKTKQGLTLRELAHAMVDPHYKLVYGKGHTKIEKKSDKRFDPLILNLKGMKSLGLVDKVLTDEAFQESYIQEEKKPTEMAKIMTEKELDSRFQRYISYSETENNLIGYLHIGVDRQIDESTYIYVKFALEEFIEKKVCFVVLDLNTPGGEVLSALKIVDLLQKLDIQHHIPVIAFVHDWAVSAGAMLAYSCRFIGIEPNSLMGAAEPVHMGQGGQMISASEKVNSALRAEFANLAMFYRRNPLIAEAMVDKDIILVIRNHKVVQLRSEDEVRTSGSNPDMIIVEKGKLLTLNAKQLMEYGVADFEVSSVALPEITEKEKEEGIWPAKKMLVFQQPYLAQIPHAMILDYHDWRIAFFTILSHPVVTSLLFIGLIIGLYIEINTPGFGIPGSIGIGCLALIVLSSFASQAVNWIEIIILCIGLILLALELFVIPGFGITGILGIVLTIIGLFALMLPGIGRFNLFDLETFYLVGFSFVERLAWLCGSLIFATVVIILLAKFFSHRYFRFSKLILKGEQETKEGYISGIPREMMPNEGDLGETVTPLRPSGKVHIGENLFDAITQGGYLESHVAVEVIRIEGSKVVVRPIEEEV
jgi:membrane-bound serine protease (ClpP class)